MCVEGESKESSLIKSTYRISEDLEKRVFKERIFSIDREEVFEGDHQDSVFSIVSY
jgi:hypothetical protein